MLLPTLKSASAIKVLAFLCIAHIANAQNVITFETTPSGGTPVDDATLNAPYAIAGGGTVRFFFDTNGNNTFDSGTDSLPVFEARGQDGVDGFTSTWGGGYDNPRPGFVGQLGNFFLRQPGSAGNVPGPFLIDYDTAQTIREFSGEIWDLDSTPGVGPGLGTEQWRVDALDGSGSVLATLTSPLGLNNEDVNSLDSLPWNFAFTNLPVDVDKVRLTFVGNKTSGIGLAFNNFSPTFAVPEPGAVALLLAGGLSGAGLFLRRRRKQSLMQTLSKGTGV